MFQDLSNAPHQSPAPDQSLGLAFLARRKLTAREREVWTLMAAGCSDAEIAQRLAVNDLTVRFHVSNLFVKLGVSEHREAVMLATRRGRLAAGTGP